MIKSFLNLEGHQNCSSGSKVTVILLKGLTFAYWWSYMWKGLRLQPAQQACYRGQIIFPTIGVFQVHSIDLAHFNIVFLHLFVLFMNTMELKGLLRYPNLIFLLQ